MLRDGAGNLTQACHTPSSDHGPWQPPPPCPCRAPFSTHIPVVTVPVPSPAQRPLLLSSRCLETATRALRQGTRAAHGEASRGAGKRGSGATGHTTRHTDRAFFFSENRRTGGPSNKQNSYRAPVTGAGIPYTGTAYLGINYYRILDRARSCIPYHTGCFYYIYI